MPIDPRGAELVRLIATGSTLKKAAETLNLSTSRTNQILVRDDLERCLAISADIAPAFEDQARRWLDPEGGKILEPGVRDRLVALIERQARTRAFIDRWGSGFKSGLQRVHESA